MEQRIHGLADNGIGYLGRAIKGVTTLWGDFWNAAYDIGRPDTLEEKLARAQQEASGVLRARYSPGGAYVSPQASANLQLAQSAVAAERALAAHDALAAKIKEEDNTLGDLGRSLDPLAAKDRDFTNQIISTSIAIKDAERALLSLGSGGGASAQRAFLTDAINKWRELQGTLMDAKAASRGALEAADTSFEIARRVGNFIPANRPAEEAYRTTFDQAKHSPDKDVRDNAKALAETAAAAATLKQTIAIQDQNLELALNTALTLKSADAWEVSGAAGMRAAAQQQAALEALQSPIDVNARSPALLAKAVADAAQAGAQQVQSLDLQAEAQRQLAEAAGQGRGAEHTAEVNLRIADATQKLRDALENASGPAAQRLREQIQGITADILSLDESASSLQIAHAFESQSEQLQVAQRNFALIRATNSERAVSIAGLQAEIEYRRMHNGVLDKEGETYIKNAENTAKLTEETKALSSEFDAINGPLQTYNEHLAALSALLAQGAISSEEFRARQRDLRIQYLETQTDFDSGVERTLLKFQKEGQDTAQVVEDAMTQSFNRIYGALEDLVTKGKTSLKSLLQDLSKIGLETFGKAGMGALSGALGGGSSGGDLFGPLAGLLGFGGGGGSIGAQTMNLGFAEGGSFVVGPDTSPVSNFGADNRIVTLHVRDRERVTVETPDQQRAAAMSSSQSGTVINQTNVMNFQNIDHVRSSERQIGRMMRERAKIS